MTSLLQDGREGRPERAESVWWNRRSAWWALSAAPLLNMTIGIVLAPKIEVYTGLACMSHRPELFEKIADNSLLKSAVVALPRLCATDPEVRRVVAQLTTAETTMLGILSCLATGWWSSLSDRTGRRTLFFAAASGMLCANVIYILVNRFWRYLPGGYWWILLGPLIEGSFGGMPASMVAFTAYVGDTTSEQRRSKTLSINFGLYWVGFSIGPLVGNLALRMTGNIMSIFYIAVTLQAAFLLYTKFIMLEPLSKAQQEQARANWKLHHEPGQQSLTRQGLLLAKVWDLFAPIVRPLEAIKPVLKKSMDPTVRPRRDWNLFLAAVSIGCLFIIAGDLPFKFQYASAAFHWTAEENGFFLSTLSASRGIYLIIILPLIIKYFKPPTQEIEIKVESDTEPSGYKTIKQKLESPTFDLRLARISIFFEGAVHVVMVLFPSPGSLYFLGVFGTVGAGFPPAVQSVALSLYIHQGGEEVGKVFGALGVIQTLCGQIISPVLYGFVYVLTVNIFPLSIFVASTIAITSSGLILFLVRMPTHHEIIAKHTDVSGFNPGTSIRWGQSTDQAGALVEI